MHKQEKVTITQEMWEMFYSMQGSPEPTGAIAESEAHAEVVTKALKGD